MPFFRRAVERIARSRVLSRRFSINARTIRLYYSPDAQLKYLRGQDHWDADIQTLARTYVTPTSVVWDIGANIGVFAFSAALAGARRVYALEPDIFLAGVMRRTVHKNGLSTVVAVLPMAIASTTGLADLLIAERGRASNALQLVGGRSQMGGVRNQVTVPVFSADDLCKATDAPPDLIKIDVEGAELHVLEGMRAIISNHRPIIYIEVGTQTQAAVEALFAEFGYAQSEIAGQGPGNLLFLPDADDGCGT